ncbi:MAG TPA: hypothetical protein VFR49_06085, partial [Solirubrobacteraceae bacterium]|nr:hypothetical protein [Solirubrobacteraceae bacterium]
RPGSEAYPDAGGHHRWRSGMARVDDLGVVDAAQIDRRDAKVGVPELALDHVQRRAISTAWAAKLMRRETAPHAGLHGDASPLRADSAGRETAVSAWVPR